MENESPVQKKSAVRRKRKRGDGEGTIYQRADGLWIGEVMIGRRLDGKPDRRKVSAKTRTEVQRKLDDLRRRAANGLIGEAAKERETVAGYLARWLEATKPTIRLRTWEHYERLVRLHIAPTLGPMKLSAVRPDDLQRLYAAKLAAGLSPKMVHHTHATLRRAFGQAVRWGYLSRDVTAAVDPPKVPHRELLPPSPTEVARLLDTACENGDRLAALWTVAAYSGCRQAELLGLVWDDVDFDAGTLTIRRILVEADNCVPLYGEPKTSKSRRTIALPSEAVAALRAHKARQNEERLSAGPDWLDYGLVFASHMGTPLLRRNVLRDYKRALGRAGLPDRFRFHDLRHAHATLKLRARVPMKAASDRLGHSTIGITMDLYTHTVPSMDAETAERIQEALRGKPEQAPPEGAERQLPH